MRGFPLRGLLTLCLLAGLAAVPGCGKKAPPRLPDTSGLSRKVLNARDDGSFTGAGPDIILFREGERG